MKKATVVAGRNTVGILTAAALTMAPTMVQAQAVGINAAVRNSVQIKPHGAANPRPAVVRQRVSMNDEVGTGAASQLQVLLLDRSVFTVGANARLKIDRFVYDPAQNTRSVGASVSRGAFRFMSGRNLNRPSGPITVRTPVASIGVRGTIFEGVVGPDAVRIAAAEPALGKSLGGDPETASLIILRGPGPGTQGDTRPGAIEVEAGGRTVVLDRPLLAAYAPAPGVPLIGPFQLSAGGLASMQHLLRTVPAGAAASRSSDTATRAANSPPPPAGPVGAGLSRFALLFGAVAVAALAALLVASAGSNEEHPVSP